jgi:hypothetical protein
MPGSDCIPLLQCRLRRNERRDRCVGVPDSGVIPAEACATHTPGVIPAKAGIQFVVGGWIPAFAG